MSIAGKKESKDELLEKNEKECQECSNVGKKYPKNGYCICTKFNRIVALDDNCLKVFYQRLITSIGNVYTSNNNCPLPFTRIRTREEVMKDMITVLSPLFPSLCSADGYCLKPDGHDGEHCNDFSFLNEIASIPIKKKVKKE